MIRRTLLLSLISGPLLAEVLTVPEPHVPFPADSTVVWSPLFQATWDEVNRVMGGKPKAIHPPNALMDRLDHFQWNPKEVMPQNGWRVWGGRATPDFLKEVNEQASRAFGHADFKVVDPVIKPDPQLTSVACFGLLERDVLFETPFCRSLKVPMKFGKQGHPVKFFGASGEASERYAKSVEVLAYRPVDKSFALEIASKVTDDKVILYRPPAAQDFAKACTWIRKWRADHDPDDSLAGSWEDRRLHRDDEVRIPYVSFDTVADMKDRLQGARIYEGSNVPWIISRAEQKTKFDLDETGARIRMETSVQMDPFAGPPATYPRKFLFDRPFFIFLWRDKAEWPYLGVWVGNAEALHPMQP